MKGFSAVAFLGLMATVALVKAQTLGGLVTNMENSIRSEVSGAENTLRRNLPRIHLPSDMPNIHMPNLDMSNINLPNMPGVPNMPNMPGIPNMSSLQLPNIISRLRSEMSALESDLSNAMPNMPSAQGIINRVRGMIRTLVPGL